MPGTARFRGSVIGGLHRAIMNGAGEDEVIEFYGQELRSGKTLVVKKDQHPQVESKLAHAAAILAESATEPA